MSSVFPERILLSVYEQADRRPVPGIAVELTLFASRKNDYDFLLPLSNKDGFVLVPRSWIEDRLARVRNAFIMDYSSKLEDCRPEVRLSVLDQKALSRAIEAMRLYQEILGISDREIALYESARNRAYTSWEKVVASGALEYMEIPLIRSG